MVATVTAAYRRWAEGCFAVWYPVLEHRPAARLERTLVATGLRRILCVELTVDLRDGPGIKGAGILLVNPPWKLDQRLRDSLPWLQDALAVGGGAHRLEWLVGE